MLSIAHRRDGNETVVLVLSGEIDYGTATILRAAISAAVGTPPRLRRLVVDLCQVRSVDPVGVGTLVVGHRICEQVGVDLTLRCRPSVLRSLVGVTAGPQLSARRFRASAPPGPTRTG
jgi:anti-anti-sigma factor